MAKFSENWVRRENAGIGKKTKEAIKGPQPLRPQIRKATKDLQMEINKLDGTSSRLKQREDTIFKKTVGAVQAHNEQMGKAYANELAEVRKMQKIVIQSRIALEQVSTRLETVTEIGDFTSTLAPTIKIVKNLRRSLDAALPDAQGALGDIGEVLNSMMSDFGQLTGTGFSLGETSEEGEKILSEATAVAENRITRDLPEVPNSGESLFNSGG